MLKFLAMRRFSYVELFSFCGLFGAFVSDRITLDLYLLGVLGIIVVSLVLEEITYERP